MSLERLPAICTGRRQDYKYSNILTSGTFVPAIHPDYLLYVISEYFDNFRMSYRSCVLMRPGLCNIFPKKYFYNHCFNSNYFIMYQMISLILGRTPEVLYNLFQSSFIKCSRIDISHFWFGEEHIR